VNNTKVYIIDSGYDINHPDFPSGSIVTGTHDEGAKANAEMDTERTLPGQSLQ
jgi:subtilisin family serine protease